MRAVVYDRYGSPDVLRLTEVDRPAPGAGEVLVRVRATSINSWDWDVLAGTFQGRLGFNAWRTPKFKTLGADVAGQIEAVGRDVNHSGSATRCTATPRRAGSAGWRSCGKMPRIWHGPSTAVPSRFWKTDEHH